MNPHDQVELLFAPPTGNAEMIRESAKQFAHDLVDNMANCEAEDIVEALRDLRSIVAIAEAAIAEAHAAHEG